MNDAQYEAVKDWCEGCLKAWVPRLGLDRYYLEFVWHRSFNPSGNIDCLASASGNWKYLSGFVEIWVPAVWNQFDEVTMLPNWPGDLEIVMVHELTHIVLNEMREWATDDDSSMKHEERVVTEVSRLFYSLYKDRDDDVQS